jgi:hypothetical protein
VRLLLLSPPTPHPPATAHCRTDCGTCHKQQWLHLCVLVRCCRCRVLDIVLCRQDFWEQMDPSHPTPPPHPLMLTTTEALDAYGACSSVPASVLVSRTRTLHMHVLALAGAGCRTCQTCAPFMKTTVRAYTRGPVSAFIASAYVYTAGIYCAHARLLHGPCECCTWLGQPKCLLFTTQSPVDGAQVITQHKFQPQSSPRLPLLHIALCVWQKIFHCHLLDPMHPLLLLVLVLLQPWVQLIRGPMQCRWWGMTTTSRPGW